MKTHKKLFLLIFAVAALSGCKAADIYDPNGRNNSVDGRSGTGSYYGDTGDTDDVYPIDPSGGSSSESTNGSGSQNKVKAGQITCSALDDNAKYQEWVSLADTDRFQRSGIFEGYINLYPFKTYNRLALTINNGNNIKVKIKNSDYETKVDNFHKAYLFPNEKKEEYEVEITYFDATNTEQSVTKTVKDGDTIDLESSFTYSNNLQLMFVIDATGSMGDEMKYLKAEIDDVIAKVQEKNTEAHIELATMVYRDVSDDYVTRYKDFTTDIDSQREFLVAQNAFGGGDIPEAVHTALKEAIEEKQWSSNATKLLFHVADAPAHNEDMQQWNTSVMKAAAQGIKIISVASSGIDKVTEYCFRSQSILTGGQYVYLTDHSGIGGNHINASTSEHLTVEYLNSCLIRLIDGYFTGNMRDPVSFKQNA